MRIKGVKEGTTTITVSAKKDGVVLASTTITVIVTASGSTDPDPTPKTPVITSGESSVQLKTNEEHSVLISTNLASNEFDHINASSKNGLVSAAVGKQASDTSYYLNLKGLKAGSDVVTVTLEGTRTNGEKVLATTKINVTVTAASATEPTKIWSNESSVTLAANSEHTVVITESGNSAGFTKSCSDTSCVDAKWGDWVDSTKKSAYLVIKGLKAGSAVITVYAKDKDGNVLASSKINVTVTGSGSETFRVWSSESSVTLNLNETRTIVVYRSSHSKTFRCENSDANCVSASLGDWADSAHNSLYLTIQGLKAGSSVVTVSAKDDSGTVLGSTKISVTVKGSGSSSTSKPGKPSGLKITKATKSKLYFSWKKVSGASGYEVNVTVDKMSKKFLKTQLNCKLRLTGFKSKASYKVKVRAYKTVNGKTIYGAWTTKKGKLK